MIIEDNYIVLLDLEYVFSFCSWCPTYRLISIKAENSQTHKTSNLATATTWTHICVEVANICVSWPAIIVSTHEKKISNWLPRLAHCCDWSAPGGFMAQWLHGAVAPWRSGRAIARIQQSSLVQVPLKLEATIYMTINIYTTLRCAHVSMNQNLF